VQIRDARTLEVLRERRLVELRIAPRSREAANDDERLDVRLA
jgi:hypothetical protein